MALCRPLLEQAAGLRAGALLREERGFIDGATGAHVKRQRRVDIRMPLKANMLATQEAIHLAPLANPWAAHPSRADQCIALGRGVEPRGAEGEGPRNAGVMRCWNQKKKRPAHRVWVTTARQLHASWIVRHDEERPAMAQDDAPRKSGGWQLQKRSATRSSEMGFYGLTVVLSYSLSQLFSNRQAGARFADKTRHALAFDQLRSRRTPVIAYAGGYFEIFETLSFARFILQLPASAQERLRHWLDEHLHTVQQRE